MRYRALYLPVMEKHCNISFDFMGTKYNSSHCFSLCDFLFLFPVLIPKEKPPITVVGDVGGRIAIIVVSGGVTGLNTLLSLFTRHCCVDKPYRKWKEQRLLTVSLFCQLFFVVVLCFCCFTLFGTWAQKINNYTFFFFFRCPSVIPHHILIHVNYRARTWLTWERQQIKNEREKI